MDDRVTGRSPTARTLERPGMLHGRVLRSPLPARARRSRAVDATRCRRAASSCCRRTSRTRSSTACLVPDTPVLARERARFVGDPVAAVAAPTPRDSRGGAATASRSTTSSCRTSTSLAAALPARRCCTTNRRLRGGGGELRDAACGPGAATCCTPLPARARRGEAGFDEAEVVGRGRVGCAGAAARAAGAARGAGRVGATAG